MTLPRVLVTPSRPWAVRSRRRINDALEARRLDVLDALGPTESAAVGLAGLLAFEEGADIVKEVHGRTLAKRRAYMLEIVILGVMGVLVVVGGLALFARDERWWSVLRWVSTTVWVAGAAALLGITVLFGLWYLSGVGRP